MTVSKTSSEKLPPIAEEMLRLKEDDKDEWPDAVERKWGMSAAYTLVMGLSLLVDDLGADLDDLSVMPHGTHVGQLSCSVTEHLWPQRYLTRCDYEVLYEARRYAKDILRFRCIPPISRPFDEICLHMAKDEAAGMLEDPELGFERLPDGGLDEEELMEGGPHDMSGRFCPDDWDEWYEEATWNDGDVEYALWYETYEVGPHSYYRFERWFDEVFNTRPRREEEHGPSMG